MSIFDCLVSVGLVKKREEPEEILGHRHRWLMDEYSKYNEIDRGVGFYKGNIYINDETLEHIRQLIPSFMLSILRTERLFGRMVIRLEFGDNVLWQFCEWCGEKDKPDENNICPRCGGYVTAKGPDIRELANIYDQ